MSETLPCACIEQVNEMLVEHNTRLTVPIVFGGRPARLLIQTEQVETGRGKKKAVAMFPSYCPFCGVNVEQSNG